MAAARAWNLHSAGVHAQTRARPWPSCSVPEGFTKGGSPRPVVLLGHSGAPGLDSRSRTGVGLATCSPGHAGALGSR
eukprot:5169857-Alexandrium_andersonii.AAC.1